MLRDVLVAGLVFGLLVSVSPFVHAEEAGRHEEHAEEAKTEAYRCVMRCEGDKTYDAPGKCPVCGMELKKIEEVPSEDEPAGHQHGAAHMEHMREVKERLKTELGDRYDEPIPPPTPSQLILGKQVYERVCWTCHGMGGKGDGPASAGLPSKPADFTDPEHSAMYSDRGRLHIIRNGIEGTPMVSWKSALSDEEIRAVYAYVRSLRTSTGEEHDEHGEPGHH